MANVVTKKVTSILCEASLDAIAEGTNENDEDNSFPSTKLQRSKLSRATGTSPERNRVPRDPSGELLVSISEELKPTSTATARSVTLKEAGGHELPGSDSSSGHRPNESKSPTKTTTSESTISSPEQRQNRSVSSPSKLAKAKSLRCISPSKPSLQKNNSCRSLGVNLSSPNKRTTKTKKIAVHGSPKKKRSQGSHHIGEKHDGPKSPEYSMHSQTENSSISTNHKTSNENLSIQQQNDSSVEKQDITVVLDDDSSSSKGDKDIVFDSRELVSDAIPSSLPAPSPTIEKGETNSPVSPIPVTSSSSSASSGSKNGKVSSSPSSVKDKLSKRSRPKTPKPQKTKSKIAMGRVRKKKPNPSFDGEMSLTLGEIFDAEELFDEPKTPSPSSRSKSPKRRKAKPADNLPSVQEDTAPREGSSSTAVETVAEDIELRANVVPEEHAPTPSSNPRSASDEANLPPASNHSAKKEESVSKTAPHGASLPLSSTHSTKKDSFNYDAEFSDPSMPSGSERDDEDDDPLTWRLDPIQSLSDWTIAVTSKEDGSVEKFHVHKNMLAVGKRKSEFFVDIFKKLNNDPIAPAVTEISMGSVAINAIPTLLDYIYSNEPLNVTTENAIGLRYLAQVFGMKTVFKSAMTFIQRDLCLAKIPHYYQTSKCLGDRKMLAIAAKHCGRNVLQIDVDSPLLSLVSASFMVEVSKSPGIDSAERARYISVLVAEYCYIHRDKLDGNTFLRLTNEENMPVIHEEAVLPLLDLESDLVVTTSLLSFTSMSSLQKRCIRDIAGSWHEISAIDPEEVSRVMRKLPSFVVAELLAKSLANIKQPSKTEETGMVSKKVVEMSLQKLRAAHEDELAEVENERNQEIERLKATVAEKEAALERYREELERFTRLPNSHEGKLVGSGPLKGYPTSLPEVIPCEKDGYILASKKGVKYPLFYYKCP